MLTLVSGGTLYVLPSTKWHRVVNQRGVYWYLNSHNNGNNLCGIVEAGCQTEFRKGTLYDGRHAYDAGPVDFTYTTINHQLDGVGYPDTTYQNEVCYLPPWDDNPSYKWNQCGYVKINDNAYCRLFLQECFLADRYGGHIEFVGPVCTLNDKKTSIHVHVYRRQTLSTGKISGYYVDLYFNIQNWQSKGASCIPTNHFSCLSYQWHGWPFKDGYDNDYNTKDFFASLFEKGYEAIPRLEMNNLDNVLRIVEVIRKPLSILEEIPKKVTDAWLWYRYSYNTTKADLEEARKHLVSVNNFQLYNGVCRCHSNRVWHENDDDWLVTMTYYAKPNQSPAARFYRLCSSYGVAPTASNLWDMVPLSFIIDWFTTMDDFVKIIDTSVELGLQAYLLSKYCICLKYDKRRTDGIVEKHFKRFILDSVPHPNTNPMAILAPDMSWIGTSTANTVRRTLDGGCLFLGG